MKQVNIPTIIIVSTFFNALFNSIASGVGFNYPYNTFLYHPSDIFADFFKSMLSFPGPPLYNFDEWSDIIKNYFNNNQYHNTISVNDPNAITHFHQSPLSVIYKITARHIISYVSPTITYLLFIFIWLTPQLAIIIHTLKNSIKGRILCLSFILSYPLLNIISRGNMEAGFVCVALTASIILILEEKKLLLSALILGIAINLRANSIIFILLPFLISSRIIAFRFFFSAIVFTALIFLATYTIANYLYSDYTIGTFIFGIERYHQIYVIGDLGLDFSSSLLGGIKLVSKIFQFNINIPKTEAAISFFSYGYLIIISIIANYLKKPVRKDIALYLVSSLYVIGFSVFGDYHLATLFVFPILYYQKKIFIEKDVILNVIIICIIICIAPKRYVFFLGISMQVLWNPFILLIGLLWVTYQQYLLFKKTPKTHTVL